jgi:translation initiation factor 5A
MKEQAEVRELKENRYVLIDDEPCRIVSITTSKPGKHGEAKARIEAIGVFDGQKRSVVFPVKHKVDVPLVEKKSAQIISIMGDNAQLMDTQNFEVFELPIPEEMKEKLQQGKEIIYLESMGKRKLMT